jgi:serine/threonine protein kinase
MFDQYVMDVADFTFVKKLSRGAFATVYLAKRKDTGQHCAIKVIVLLHFDSSLNEKHGWYLLSAPLTPLIFLFFYRCSIQFYFPPGHEQSVYQGEQHGGPGAEREEYHVFYRILQSEVSVTPAAFIIVSVCINHCVMRVVGNQLQRF